VAIEQLRQALLMYRGDTPPQHVEPSLAGLRTHDLVTVLGKSEGRDKADVTSSDDAYMHQASAASR
jgi:hypothetical protein